MTKPPWIGGLLAGGASRRMGRTKAGLPMPDGRNLATPAAEALAALCGEVYILGHGAGTEGLPFPRLDDPTPGQGPLGGLMGLLSHRPNRRYLILPCDLPAVRQAALAPLLEGLGQGLACAYRLPSGRWMSLPLALSYQAADLLEDHLRQGRLALKHLLDALPAKGLAADEALLAELKGLNTRKEWEATLGAFPQANGEG